VLPPVGCRWLAPTRADLWLTPPTTPPPPPNTHAHTTQPVGSRLVGCVAAVVVRLSTTNTSLIARCWMFAVALPHLHPPSPLVTSHVARPIGYTTSQDCSIWIMTGYVTVRLGSGSDGSLLPLSSKGCRTYLVTAAPSCCPPPPPQGVANMTHLVTAPPPPPHGVVTAAPSSSGCRT
jgi:hypothetical protein